MNQANPYTPPRANVADVNPSTGEEEFQPIKMWSSKGRIGRLRYLAYSMVATILVALLGGVLGAILGSGVGPVVMLIAYIPFLIFCAFIVIQRSHDMGWSGWASLFTLIPLVSLIWVFKAGTKSENDYGAPPPPNTTSVKVLGLLLPIVVVVLSGILAAIAIPAYQQYVLRAKAAQQQTP